MMRHQADPIRTAMKSDREVMPPAATARVSVNNGQLLWHTIGKGRPGRTLAAVAEEIAATAATAAASTIGGDEGSVQRSVQAGGRNST